jgi:hypothetical protein
MGSAPGFTREDEEGWGRGCGVGCVLEGQGFQWGKGMNENGKRKKSGLKLVDLRIALQTRLCCVKSIIILIMTIYQ